MSELNAESSVTSRPGCIAMPSFTLATPVNVTVGATSKIESFVRLFDGRTRAPQAARTPFIRCQYAAVAQLNEERAHVRSAPHLKP